MMSTARPALAWLRIATVAAVVLAVFAVSAQLVDRDVSAAGPPYSGPQTTANGPAYFGPAPNPLPYCENPTYFDPFPENVNPVGRLDLGAGPEASVTTDNITMDFDLTAEAITDHQYPGFFPNGADGAAGDQPKGVEMQGDPGDTDGNGFLGDAATVTLSEPLFYSQWVFTDVDQDNEGFDVVPAWTDPAAPGAVAVYGGDANFEFTGTTQNLAQFNDTNRIGQASESLAGRVQVDFIGAVTGITMTRDPGRGQSGFAVGGGCSPIGVAKEVSNGPTWNGNSFDVSYTIRVRNNLPSTQTLTADAANALAAAIANGGSGVIEGTPTGIELTQLELRDILTDAAFGDINVVSVTNVSGNVATNPNYDGDMDTNLIAAGESIPPETEEEFVLVLEYIPEQTGPLGPTCSATYSLNNSAIVSGQATGVAVQDESDEGVDPDPGVDNGGGGVDDPTVVEFDCPPAELEIVKTVVPGPMGTCPDFDNGVVGDGPALVAPNGSTVTYCITVRNMGSVQASGVTVSDPQAPVSFNGNIGTVAAGGTETVQFDLVVDENTPTQNTATATGTGPNGENLGPVTDTALISLAAEPSLAVVKTAVVGPMGTCPDFANGVAGDGAALVVPTGSTVTYCITVRNAGPGDATNVVVSDPQAPAGFDGNIGNLAAGAEATRMFDLVVDDNTPTKNTATVNGNGPAGPLTPIEDTALIGIDPEPSLAVVKTAVVGPMGTCPDFANGVAGDGAALVVPTGSTVTYCITVRNAGPGDATDVVVSDPQAPAGFDGNIGNLAAGAEATRMFDLVVDDNTPTQNTATVNGNGPAGPLTPIEDTALIGIDPEPALAVVKTAVAGPNGTCPDFANGVAGDGAPLQIPTGQTVTYCITVRNAGPGDATGVVVSDPQAPAGFDGNIGNLAANAEATRAFDLVVDDNTPTRNTATANGEGPSGPVTPIEDTAVIEVLLDPAIAVVKSVVVGPNGTCPAFDAGTQGDGDALVVPTGSTVTYCISVRNVGLGDATAVMVSDPQAPAGFDGNIGSLASMQERTVQFDLVVDGNTPPQNTATVTGQGPNGDLPEVTDTALIDVELEPDLAVVKTAIVGPNGTCPDFANGQAGQGDALEVSAGDTVTYCITVRNAGPGNATDVVVADPQAPAGFDGAIGDLGADTERTVRFDVVVDADTPPQNTATVTGEGPNGPLPPEEDTSLIGAPSIQVTKTVVAAGGNCAATTEGTHENLVGEAGDAIIWCITVTNTGNTSLTNVLVDDTLESISNLDVLDVHGGGAASLAPAASISFEIPGVVRQANTINTVEVTAVPSDPNGTLIPGLNPVSDDNTASTDSTSLQITKSVAPGAGADCATAVNSVAVPRGTTVTFCFTVTNTGSVDLRVTQVVDNDLGITVPVPAADQVIAPGASTTVSIEQIADDLTNTASATGTPVDDNGDPIPNAPEPTDTDDSVVTTQTPRLDIVKTSVPGPNGTCPATVAAGVRGAGTPLDVDFGDVVTYCLNVANIGEVAIDNVRLVDPQAPAGFDGNVGTLAVGQEASASFDIVVLSDTPSRNTASVTGDDPAGGDLPPTEDPALVDVPTPDPQILLTKTVIAADGDCADAEQGVDELVIGSIGDAIIWCFEVTNTGNVALTQVVLEDAPVNLDGVDLLDTYTDLTVLVPGAKLNFSVEGTIPEDGLDNVATVSGAPSEPDGTPIPNSAPVEDDDDAAVDDLVADLAVVKSVDNPGPTALGANLNYTVVVSNAGPDPAENVVLTDQIPAGIEALTIPSADGWTCTETDTGYRCERADPMPSGGSDTLTYTARSTNAAGPGVSLINTVTVTSTTDDPNLDDNTDTAVTRYQFPRVDVPIEPTPQPEYPGPFTPPPAPKPPLAYTGGETLVLVAMAAAMFTLGGMLIIGKRRRHD